MTTINVKTLKSKIEKLAKAEVSVKTFLGELSRDLLQHFLNTGDVSLINLLLGNDCLSLNNQRTAKVFFVEFIYHTINKENPYQFLGKKKLTEAKEAEARNAIIEFLNDPNNTLWTWAKSNTSVEKVKPTKEDKFKKMAKSLIEENSPEYVIELLISLNDTKLNDMLIALNKGA